MKSFTTQYILGINGNLLFIKKSFELKNKLKILTSGTIFEYTTSLSKANS